MMLSFNCTIYLQLDEIYNDDTQFGHYYYINSYPGYTQMI